MFICGICKKSSKSGEKATRVVVERKLVRYPFIEQAHSYTDVEGTHKIKDDPGGSGMAIAKEMLICSNHAESTLQAEK